MGQLWTSVAVVGHRKGKWGYSGYRVLTGIFADFSRDFYLNTIDRCLEAGESHRWMYTTITAPTARRVKSAGNSVADALHGDTALSANHVAVFKLWQRDSGTKTRTSLQKSLNLQTRLTQLEGLAAMLAPGGQSALSRVSELDACGGVVERVQRVVDGGLDARHVLRRLRGPGDVGNLGG